MVVAPIAPPLELGHVNAVPLVGFAVVEVTPGGAAGSHGCWDWHGEGWEHHLAHGSSLPVAVSQASPPHLRKGSISIFSPSRQLVDKSSTARWCSCTALGGPTLAGGGTFPVSPITQSTEGNQKHTQQSISLLI